MILGRQMRLAPSSFTGQTALDRQRAKGVTLINGTTHLPEKKNRRHLLRASYGYKAAGWQGARDEQPLIFLPWQKTNLEQAENRQF